MAFLGPRPGDHVDQRESNGETQDFPDEKRRFDQRIYIDSYGGALWHEAVAHVCEQGDKVQHEGQGCGHGTRAWNEFADLQFKKPPGEKT
jgi:hypothetical protein